LLSGFGGLSGFLDNISDKINLGLLVVVISFGFDVLISCFTLILIIDGFFSLFQALDRAVAFRKEYRQVMKNLKKAKEAIYDKN
jgi:phosphatidylglycerophosphate synthase